MFALTGGFAPLMPAVDLSLLKKKPPSDKKVFFFLVGVVICVAVCISCLYNIR